MQHLPGDFTPVAGARRLGHRQMGGRQEMQLNTREQATFHQPLQPAEGRQFGAFNTQRHNGRLRFGGDKGGAVINFISEPLTEIRPSGKITTGRPCSIRRTRCLIDIGLVGSSGTKSIIGVSARINQRWLIEV